MHAMISQSLSESLIQTVENNGRIRKTTTCPSTFFFSFVVIEKKTFMAAFNNLVSQAVPSQHKPHLKNKRILWENVIIKIESKLLSYFCHELSLQSPSFLNKHLSICQLVETKDGNEQNFIWSFFILVIDRIKEAADKTSSNTRKQAEFPWCAAVLVSNHAGILLARGTQSVRCHKYQERLIKTPQIRNSDAPALSQQVGNKTCQHVLWIHICTSMETSSIR